MKSSTLQVNIKRRSKMADYSHVDDAEVRDFLEGKIELYDDAMADMLARVRSQFDQTKGALDEAERDEREELLAWAEGEFNEEGRDDKVWEPLQQFFSRSAPAPGAVPSL